MVLCVCVCVSVAAGRVQNLCVCVQIYLMHSVSRCLFARASDSL
jgi:hypothetical protein